MNCTNTSAIIDLNKSLMKIGPDGKISSETMLAQRNEVIEQNIVRSAYWDWTEKQFS